MEIDERSVSVVGGMVPKERAVFSIPDEELKAYYLKEAVLLSPSYCTPNRTEFEILSILQKEQKKILNFLTTLISCSWEESVLNLHLISVPYLLEPQVSEKEKRRVSSQLTEYIRLSSFLAGNRYVATELYTLYNRHNVNVVRLLKQFPEYRQREKQNVE